MRSKVECVGLVLTMGLATSGVCAQNPGARTQTQGSHERRWPWARHGDAHELARENAAPAGPLKITFGDKSAEWTPATLAALPHTTVTVYNEHAKANQTYSGVPLIDLLSHWACPTSRAASSSASTWWPWDRTAMRWSTRWAKLIPTCMTPPCWWPTRRRQGDRRRRAAQDGRHRRKAARALGAQPGRHPGACGPVMGTVEVRDRPLIPRQQDRG